MADSMEPDRIIKSKLLVKNNKNGVDQMLPETTAAQVLMDSGMNLETKINDLQSNSNNSVKVVTQLPDTLSDGVTYLEVK